MTFVARLTPSLFALAALLTAAGWMPVMAQGESLMSLWGNPAGQQDFLRPEEAFDLAIKRADAQQLHLTWSIAPGYYLYRDQMKVSVNDRDLVAAGRVERPAGKAKTDEFYGQTAVYYDRAVLTAQVPERTGTLTVGYQGCAENGICYPPQSVSLSLAALNEAAPFAGGDLERSEQGRLAGLLAGGSWVRISATFFGLGLLLAFTPCVLPMVPILAGLIVGDRAGTSTARAFALSLVYVLAMASTYTAAGVAAGMFGANLQAYAQHPWVLVGFAAIFVALALAMFEVYPLQMPPALQARLTAVSSRQRGGTWLGVAVMGLLSALIVGPCVAAPLAGALLYITQTGDAGLGGLALFSLSLGMGAPLLAVGASAGTLVPRAGAWMQAVKSAFGILLLGVAIWMLERLLPPSAGLALWAALLILTAVLMGALRRSEASDSPGVRLARGAGLVLLLYGAVLMIGAAGGGDRFWPPLAHLQTRTAQVPGEKQALAFKSIENRQALERALSRAAAQGRPAMLDFYADWCIECKIMERTTFSDPAVRQAVGDAVLLQADVTENDAEDRALMRSLEVIGPPTILFYDEQGREQRTYRLVGTLGPAAFAEHLRRVFGADTTDSPGNIDR